MTDPIGIVARMTGGEGVVHGRRVTAIDTARSVLGERSGDLSAKSGIWTRQGYVLKADARIIQT